MAVKTCRKVEYNLKSMAIFSIITKIFLKIEKTWLDSYIRRAYPTGKFLKFLEKSSILKEHIFAPPLFIVAFSLFMIIAATPISLGLQLNIFIGFLFFLFFSLLTPKLLLKDVKFYLEFDSKDINSIGFTLFIVGIIFFVITIMAVGGLPILKPNLRYALNPKLTIPAFFMIPGIAMMSSHILNKMKKGLINKPAAKFRIITLTLICIIILGLLGYRTPLVSIILIIAIMGYYSDLFEIWEILASFIFVILFIMGIGYIRSIEEYSLNNLSALDFLKIRAAFTLNVLDLLSHLSGLTGALHGKLALSMIPGAGNGPRALIAKLISWRGGVTITPTIFGQMLVDFGTIGVAVGMSIFGFITGVGYRIMKKTGDTFYIMLYSLIMSYFLISVETGILDQTVIGYIIIAAIIYIYNILKFKN
ncbi:oligosaccharide repeat unit polymerase family protein [Methanothermobacter sp.]|uniref:oligosaccharide repeat unit polymerase family protein n=1 Tax=Methanothermobacter sp. TaxID=1884223 RepID=UPI0026090837|nr:oligosaccharide repeat unit polymerase family protein [Methanothermobacter sp.]MDI9614069.1 oligosaccharide repeat unit polymerase family protein [Methanothermobacter sp.]